MNLDPFALNLRHLRAVIAIADSGKMSAAAQAICLSQPALTPGVVKLERQLGQSLFDRRPDGLRPAPASLLLVDRARAGLAHLAQTARPTTRGPARGFIRGVLRDSDFLTLLSVDQIALEIDSKVLAAIGPPLPQGLRTIGITTC